MADICERKTKSTVFKVNFIKLSWEATQKIIDKMRMDMHYAKMRRMGMQPDRSKYRPISLSPEEIQSQIRSSWKEINYDEIRS